MTIDERSGTSPKHLMIDASEPEVPASAVPWTDLPIRVLMCLLFFLSGIGKLLAVSATQNYMAAHGVPAFLIWPAAAIEIVGGLLLLVGLFTRPLGIVLAGWCLLTAAIFHTDLSDQNQMINFLKNLAIAGGFILLARHGARALGVDGILSHRRRTGA